MLFFLLFSVATAYTDFEYEVSFRTFLKEHNKVYDSDELIHRYNIFKANMDTVLNHNSGDHSWTMAVNKYSDMTPTEFKKIMNGFKGKKKQNSTDSYSKDFVEIDWVKKGAVTPIKNQFLCGSCWAFSAVGGVEGSEFVDNKTVTSLSEQALVDCANSFGNHACNGGLMDNAFKYIKSKGIPTEKDYPYDGIKDPCKKKIAAHTKITSYKDVKNLEVALQQQPISVAVDASGWQMYNSGIFHCWKVPDIDHGVTLVASYSDYWIIKNSWGTDWGEKGYIRLSKNPKRNCGVDQSASYPMGA